jgi:shikimate dehydrogenase
MEEKMTDRYAVIGNPIAHTKSPALHLAFARQCEEEISYEAIQAPLGGFVEAAEAFRQAGGKGLNISFPFKIDALRYAEHLTPRARLAGAVNTLSFDGGSIYGDNTDGLGLVSDIQERLRFNIKGKRVLLLGAGGAARGVVLPLLEQAPASLMIVNRDQGKVESLQMQFAEFSDFDIGTYGALAGQSFDLVINATSAGLNGEHLPLPEGLFAPRSLAYDMVYGDSATPFELDALRLGASRTADGLGMLVAQAAESFYVWRGHRPDTTPVLAGLQQDLAAR